jgi:hypothetical protein
MRRFLKKANSQTAQSPTSTAVPFWLRLTPTRQGTALGAPLNTQHELKPQDRVEGLGNFGAPNGKNWQVQRTNDEDALVKWDDNALDLNNRASRRSTQQDLAIGASQ